MVTTMFHNIYAKLNFNIENKVIYISCVSMIIVDKDHYLCRCACNKDLCNGSTTTTTSSLLLSLLLLAVATIM